MQPSAIRMLALAPILALLLTFAYQVNADDKMQEKLAKVVITIQVTQEQKAKIAGIKKDYAQQIKKLRDQEQADIDAVLHPKQADK